MPARQPGFDTFVSDDGLDARLARAFTALEVRVLETLWTRALPQTVADVHRVLTGLPYTTVMTAFERLFSRGAVSRYKDGRAFVYQATATREACLEKLTRSMLSDALPSDPDGARAVMATFVDTLVERDSSLLDELESMLQERRSGGRPHT